MPVVRDAISKQLEEHIHAGRIDEANELLRRKANHAKMALRDLKKPFICLPSQLDTTQPEDFGYGTPEWHVEWVKQHYEDRRRKADVGHNLSCAKNLGFEVVAKYVLRRIGSSTGVAAEISKKGKRRCCFVRNNGMRCLRYANTPVCHFHFKVVQGTEYMNERFLNAITSVPLREAFESHLNDPARRSIEKELALARTMLDVIMLRINAKQDLTDIAPAEVNAIMQMTKMISELVERMVGIEQKMGMRLSVDQVMALMARMIDHVVTICQPTPSQCIELATATETLAVFKVASKDTIEKTKMYGAETPPGVKMSGPRDKYLDDGKVIKDHFTEAEVLEVKAETNARFVDRINHVGPK